MDTVGCTAGCTAGLQTEAKRNTLTTNVAGEKRKREPVSHNVSVRFREAEAKFLEQLAFTDDLSIGAWIRKLVLKTLVRRGLQTPINGAEVPETQDE
jgi:hypothetical protein